MTSRERATLKELVDEVRRKREHVNRQTRERVCSGCQIDFDAYTTGCRQCISRLANRKLRGYALTRGCKGCGGNLNDLSPGCVTCRERSKSRGYGRNGDYVPPGARVAA